MLNTGWNCSKVGNKLLFPNHKRKLLSSENGMVKETGASPFLIDGAIGSCVGSTELLQKAANVIHETCKYLLKEKSDDSILLPLLIRMMDNLGNHGSAEYEEWSNHRQAWKQESTAIIEPPINFIVPSHSKGKRRLATKCILNMMKRWPSTISKCVLSLAENLKKPSLPKNAVLGSCTVLSSQTVLKCLTTDRKALSLFLLGILYRSHNETQKAQKAITEVS